MHWYMRKNTVPKSMPTKETEALLSELRETLSAAKMERADFGEQTEFIKKRTDLYRESYLISPLADLIKRYENAGFR